MLFLSSSILKNVRCNSFEQKKKEHISKTAKPENKLP